MTAAGSRPAITALFDRARLQAQIIEELLDMASVLAAKLRIEPTQVDIGRIVEEAVSAVASAAQARQLELEVRIDDPGVILLGDPMRIRQILWNLGSHAVKFTSHCKPAHLKASLHARRDQSVSNFLRNAGVTAGLTPGQHTRRKATRDA